MEFSPTPPPAIRPFWRRPGVLLAAVALVLYAAVLARYMNVCAGGSDSSGYLNHAKLLGSGRVHAAPRVMPELPEAQTPQYLYSPLGFKPGPGGPGLVPTYPSGLPLLIMAAAKLVGWRHGGDLVIGLHALLGVLLTYALGRSLRLSPRGAVLGATIVAVSPLYLDYSLQAMSDMPSLVWITAAVVAAGKRGQVADLAVNRKIRDLTPSVFALGAGAAFSMAVLIRPSNIIGLAPVAIALGGSFRRWVIFGLGALPGAIFFCLHAEAAYGSVLTTGYGDTWSSFSTGVVPGTLLHYLHWLPVFFTPVVLLSLGLPWLVRALPRAAAIVGTWALVYLVFYSFYFHTHETWWYLRFVLPAMPALVIGGLLVARRLWGQVDYLAVNRKIIDLTPYLVFALVLANGAWWTRKFDVLSVGRWERTYPRTMAWLVSHVPANSVLAVMQTSGAVEYYTPFTFVRWDQLDPESFARVAKAAEKAHRPIYAPLFSFESADALQKHMPGAWSRVGSVADVTIWRLDGK